MNKAQLNGMRETAKAVCDEGNYQLWVNGKLIMFGLTKDRAENFSKFYKNATVKN